jgi:hypothetical protein
MFMDKINIQENYLDTNGFPSDNSQEILSDTLQCLQDLVTMIQQNWGQYGVLISQDVSFYPAVDETTDKATGIVARIVLRTRQVNCVIPEFPYWINPTPFPSCYELLRYEQPFEPVRNFNYAGYGWIDWLGGNTITVNSGMAPDGNYYTIYTNDYVTGIGVIFNGTTWVDNAYNYFDLNNGWFGTFSATTVSGYVIPAEQTNLDGTLSYPNCPPPCSSTTQYMEVELEDNTKFKLILWNTSGFTSPATALCDYTVSGTAYGSSGTVYTSTEQITSGQHQHQFNLAPVLDPGEIVTGFTVYNVDTSTCVCPVIVDFSPYT